MVGPEMEHIGGDGEKSGKEKLPYNLRERKIKHASYREIIRAGLADELYDGILKIVVEEKKYKDAYYSAKELEKDLHTNPRYLTSVIN